MGDVLIFNKRPYENSGRHYELSDILNDGDPVSAKQINFRTESQLLVSGVDTFDMCYMHFSIQYITMII